MTNYNETGGMSMSAKPRNRRRGSAFFSRLLRKPKTRKTSTRAGTPLQHQFRGVSISAEPISTTQQDYAERHSDTERGNFPTTTNEESMLQMALFCIEYAVDEDLDLDFLPLD